MLNELAKEIHDNAVEHGWWEGEERNFGEVIALCHSELSEALEEKRAGRPMEYVFAIDELGQPTCDEEVHLYHGSKTEGIAVEMCDCIIRILDYLATTGVDIDACMRRKMNYNKTRPYKHGKNF